MREPENIRQLLDLVEPDFMGMIFYQKSPRFISQLDWESFQWENTQRVGVFVNESISTINTAVEMFGLQILQLHGGESIETVRELKQKVALPIIKVFSVQDVLPLKEMEAFTKEVDYFLLDTKTPAYGGSGHQFDWSILSEYSFDVPFFLSGGIGTNDIEKIKTINLHNLFAIDVNSKFEKQPGLKDIESIIQFKKGLA